MPEHKPEQPAPRRPSDAAAVPTARRDDQRRAVVDDGELHGGRADRVHGEVCR